VLAVAALMVPLAAGCTDDSTPEPTPSPSTSASSPADVHLTFGVYGSAREIAVYRSTVRIWNAQPDNASVRLRTWPSAAAMRQAVAQGAPMPDVFLTPRTDLRWLLDHNYTQPVDELLDERGVDFGDGYSRDALEAFSAEDRLQCMPYGISPMLIYYNKQLVNFDRMRKRGLDAPDDDATSWSFEQFSAAAQFASRPRRGTKGVHIAATLPGLAPFIVSGGGSVFDDASDPKSLTFSSDDSKAALEQTLELLRNPQLTLDEAELARATPIRWFERGKLAMIAGYRSLVPQLRQKPGLDFDVMPMPNLDHGATVGDISGLCLAKKADNAPAAADFIVHELSKESVGAVARTGYLAPANLEVALSDDFLQPGRRPAHAQFFTTTVRSMIFAPLIDNLPELEAAVQPSLEQLVYGVGVLDLDGITEQIDQESRPILDPESASPSTSEPPSS